MTILEKNCYSTDHVLRRSKRVLEANAKYYNDDFFYIKHVVLSVERYTPCAHSKVGYLQTVIGMEMIHY